MLCTAVCRARNFSARRRLLPLFSILAVLLAAGSLAFSQSVPVSAATVSNRWMVELAGPPTADGGNLAALQKDHAAFRSAAAAANIPYVERKAYNSLFNGFAVTATRSAAAMLGSLPGVKGVYPDNVLTYDPRPGTSETEMATAISMTGADKVQSNLLLTGEGVKVGVIDTGIDYHHPDLGECSKIGGTCRVAGGYDLVGDGYDAAGTGEKLIPHPDDDPMDCAGHGTHVAGIIGANGDPEAGHVKGVAPGVTFYAYRVFGCSGSTSDSVMIDAMERALNDGVQVVNMSIGAAFGWPQWPTALASDRLVKKGVVVVSSFGNSGANGLYSGGAPGLGSLVIGVASFDNTYTPSSVFTVSPDNRQVGYNSATAAAPAPLSGSQTIVAPSSNNTLGCYAYSAADKNAAAGNLVLVQRGTPAGFPGGSCGFYLKALNAQNAGAAGVVLYNNTSGTINPTVAGATPITIPVAAITLADGNLLASRISGGATVVTWTTLVMETPNPQGGLISSFSSYGLSPDLIFKPDVGAPGGNIRSTYPLALGGYAVMSGTSMSSPHVAGAVALLLEANPKLQARKVRDILQNTSVPKNWWGNPALGFLDNSFRQGAGMLNIYDAITATTRITPGKIALGEGQAGPQTQTLTLSNSGENNVTYNLSWVSGIAANQGDSYTQNSTYPTGHYTQGFWLTNESVKFTPSTVTVPADSEVQVTVTITPPTLDPNGAPEDSLYGGWLVFTPTVDGATLRVPYAGIVGNYQAIQAVTPTPYVFPWLARVVETSYEMQMDGAVYTLANGDIPYILMHFEHQFQQLQMQVLDPATGRNYQYIDNEKYLPSNSTPLGFYAFSFDGTTFTPSGKKAFTVPNGNYVISVRALKALGNPDNPADWETWTSPAFTIDRPQ